MSAKTTQLLSSGEFLQTALCYFTCEKCLCKRSFLYQ